MTDILKHACVVVLATLTLAGCSGPTQDKAQGQNIQHRVAAFKKMLQSMEQMGMVVRERQEYKAEDFLERARELKKLAQEPWQYFTPDSQNQPTRAKPDIWEHPANFTEFRKDLDESLNQLIVASQSGDIEKIATAYTSVEDSCQACHQRFRKPLQ